MTPRVTRVVFAATGTFLFMFLLYPLWGVLRNAVYFNGTLTVSYITATLFSQTVLISLRNSLALAITATFFSALIALPLAGALSRYRFTGRDLLSGMLLIPMIMPPFVGAIGVKRLFARYGMVNMLFGTAPYDWFGEAGIISIAFLQALHLFPVMYLNIIAALSNIDPRLSEASRLCGAGPVRTFRHVTLPLLRPGLLSGSLIVFLWSFTDLGTPLILGFRQVVSVEVFDRVASVNNDPTGSVMVLIITVITVIMVAVFKKFGDPGTVTEGSKGMDQTVLRTPGTLTRTCIYCFGTFVLLCALLPHAGLILTSVADDWFMSVLPQAVTGRFYADVFASEGVAAALNNSLFYAGASTLIDIVLGTLIAWAVLRSRARAGWLIDAMVMLPLALPGLVLAFGYVATFSGTLVDPLRNPVPLLIIGYAVRRLPFCFRAAYAGLQQVGVGFEDAARLCGASPLKAVRTITLPLIGANIIAGGLLSLLFAMLEVSESMVLAVKKEFFPITRQIYVLLGSIPDGDLVASALGVLCMCFLAAGLLVAGRLMGKHLGKVFRM